MSWAQWWASDGRPSAAPMGGGAGSGLKFLAMAAIVVVVTLFQQRATAAVFGWIGFVAVAAPMVVPMLDGYWWLYPPLELVAFQTMGVGVALVGELLSPPPPPTT